MEKFTFEGKWRYLWELDGKSIKSEGELTSPLPHLVIVYSLALVPRLELALLGLESTLRISRASRMK